MSPDEFCRWLQGFAELSEGEMPTQKQWTAIKKHLETVFVKVTDKDDKALREAVTALRSHPGPTRIC